MNRIDAADYTWREEAGGEAAARKCLDFLEQIGIETAPMEEGKPQFLDGLAIGGGRLLIDPTVAVWPSDLLHEAGHIAVADPAIRPTLCEIEADGGDEMAAIAWSYAASLACDLPLDLLFHDGGYRGGSQSLRDAFAEGSYIGAPMLGFWGLCDPDRQPGDHPFPKMKRWLR